MLTKGGKFVSGGGDDGVRPSGIGSGFDGGEDCATAGGASVKTRTAKIRKIRDGNMAQNLTKKTDCAEQTLPVFKKFVQA